MSKNGYRVFGPSEAKGGCAVDPAKTAVIFIEYQNEFTSEGGKMHDAVKVIGNFLFECWSSRHFKNLTKLYQKTVKNVTDSGTPTDYKKMTFNTKITISGQ